jgi:hypothetical protein
MKRVDRARKVPQMPEREFGCGFLRLLSLPFLRWRASLSARRLWRENCLAKLPSQLPKEGQIKWMAPEPGRTLVSLGTW